MAVDTLLRRRPLSGYGTPPRPPETPQGPGLLLQTPLSSACSLWSTHDKGSLLPVRSRQRRRHSLQGRGKSRARAASFGSPRARPVNTRTRLGGNLSWYHGSRSRTDFCRAYPGTRIFVYAIAGRGAPSACLHAINKCRHDYSAYVCRCRYLQGPV